MNRYFRVETSTGILRTASSTLSAALYWVKNDEHVCTLIGPCTPDEYQKIHDLLWPK